MLININSLIGMHVDDAKKLASDNGYEVWVLDKDVEDKKKPDPKYKKPPFQSTKLTIVHQNGVVFKAKVG